MEKCKQLLRQCIKEREAAFIIVGKGKDAVFASQWPEFCHRYLAMAYIDCFVATEEEGCSRASILLLPRTDSERCETVLWLNKLLRHIHQEVRQICVV